MEKNLNEQIADNYIELMTYTMQFFREHHEGPFSFENRNRGQAIVLEILKQCEQISQKELVQMLNMQPQSASEIIKKLEKKGYITREKSVHDKRVYNITLTVKGRVSANKVGEFKPVIFDSLTDEEKIQLIHISQKITANIKTKVKRQPNTDRRLKQLDRKL